MKGEYAEVDLKVMDLEFHTVSPINKHVPNAAESIPTLGRWHASKVLGLHNQVNQ